jgi:membrane associated rhomboid family serine protease
VIPLKDENPTEITPVITLLFIAMNAAAWFLLQGAGDARVLEASVVHYGAIPCEVTTRCAVEGLGIGAVLSSMFMHGSWEHIIGNMLFLWVFGNNVEDSMGYLRFIVFYLICGLAAASAQILFDPGGDIPMVGASGAISGIMGAYVVLYPKARVRTWVPPLFFLDLRAGFFLVYWFVMQLFMAGASSVGGDGAQGGVAVWAHIGGFVAGVVLIKLFARRRLVEAKTQHIRLPAEEVARMRW